MSKSSGFAIQLQGVGKRYKLYPSRAWTVLDALGLTRLTARRRPAFEEFWALRGIDFELRQGERVGIVGRNGAGKSTLLKLISGSLEPTEGHVHVSGRVQALFQTGTGFHPEFTGHENVEAALTYQGLSTAEMRNAAREIAEFTELGSFLDQPLKTYSAGMQARLAFAAATVVKPEILIIDEVLGAGDAYFLSKSNDRMQGLISGGTSILLVSHALEQITMLCERAVWIDRGQVVQSGSSLEIVKAYQQYMRVLDDRRLKARNRKMLSGTVTALEAENYSDSLSIVLTPEGGASCDVRAVTLWKDGAVEERLAVGQPQDADSRHPSFLVLDKGSWSPPRSSDDGMYRTISPGTQRAGVIVFNLYHLAGDASYAVSIESRPAVPEGTASSSSLRVEVLWNSAPHLNASLPVESAGWQHHRLPLAPFQAPDRGPAGAARHGNAPSTAAGAQAQGLAHTYNASVRRWPGEGSLTIAHVVLEGAGEKEQAVFRPGTLLRVRVRVLLNADGAFPVQPTTVVYRRDGLRVMTHIGPFVDVSGSRGDELETRLDLGPLNLGDGLYVISIGLYRTLSQVGQSVYYDLLDRSFEFQVVGNAPFAGLFEHPGTWSWQCPPASAAVAMSREEVHTAASATRAGAEVAVLPAAART